jgi:hypothetical protein
MSSLIMKKKETGRTGWTKERMLWTIFVLIGVAVFLGVLDVLFVTERISSVLGPPAGLP